MLRTKTPADIRWFAIYSSGCAWLFSVQCYRSPPRLGIFLHIGSKFCKAKILYLRPGIVNNLLYIINAFGLWIGSGSVGGLGWSWFIAITFFVSYRVVRPALNPLSSFVVI
jgi:hypothetical protein